MGSNLGYLLFYFTYVLMMNFDSYFSGQIENLPHSQLVYGYATSAQKTNNSLTRTLTCLCYNFITNIVEGKKKNPLLYKKSNQNRTNSVNLYLNKKNHTYENHIGHFDLGFLEKNHSKNLFLLS